MEFGNGMASRLRSTLFGALSVVVITASSAAQGAEVKAPAAERFVRAGENGAVVRNLADRQGLALTELAPDSVIGIFKERAGWMQVEVPGGFPVWIYGRYVRATSEDSVYEVTGNGVNLRPRPNREVSNFPLSGRLHAGDRVLAIERQDESLPLEEDWIRIWSPSGIRGWISSDGTKPIAGDGAVAWVDAARELFEREAPLARANELDRKTTPASTAGTDKSTVETTEAVAKPKAKDADAMDALEQARALLAEQRTQANPNFASVREAYSRVITIEPEGVAAMLAKQGIETVEALEAAASIREELEGEKKRREEELLKRQEEIWETSRKKDPLLGKFAGRGVLERRIVPGSEARFWLRWRGADAYELVCKSGRYDLNLFAGYEIGVEGVVGEAPVGGAPAVMDVAKLQVLSRR